VGVSPHPVHPHPLLLLLLPAACLVTKPAFAVSASAAAGYAIKLTHHGE